MTTSDVVVPPDLDGERADKVLAHVLDMPRSTARSVIDDDGATVGGEPVRPSDRLAAGTHLVVSIPDIDRRLEAEPSVPFVVRYEDDDLLVVDKPAGVVVHPTSSRSKGTLVHGLLARYPDIRGVGQEQRWGIVHRLDRDTSGLLVVARSHDAYAALVAMMKGRAVHRRYLAMVDGTFDNTVGTIDAPLARDPANPTRVRMDRAGRSARTHYRRLAGWDAPACSLLSVTLDTGRTHQIRVHMQAIGHPIVGDAAYGRRGGASVGRPWLHARELSFDHPLRDEHVDVLAPLPGDLADRLATLGEPATGEVVDDGGIEL